MLLRRIGLYINLRLITNLKIPELDTTEDLDALLWNMNEYPFLCFVSLCFNLYTTQYDNISV